MKKWLLIGAGLIVVIIIVLVVTVASNIGPMIKTAVNTYGPDITKTDVKLEDVQISIFSAEAKLKNFLLGNPKGFQSAYAVKVGSVQVNVDEKSITGDTIAIDSIQVIAPDISYEKISGTDNFQTILNNVKKSVGAEKQTSAKKADADDKKEGKKILIRNFIVKDGKVNLTSSLLAGKTISAPLPDIHLKDIGNQKGGASPAEAFNEIFKALYAKITSQSVNDILNQGLKGLGTNVDALGKTVADEIKKKTGDLKSLGIDTDKGVSDAAKKIKGLLGN